MKQNEPIKITEDNYYEDITHISSSMFSAWLKCPHYFEAKYITKTYIEPDRDYFTFGRAVDCLLTENLNFDGRFITVDSYVDVTNAQTLEFELNEYIKKLNDAQIINAKATKKSEEVATKALENKIQSLKEKLDIILAVKGKEQLTNAMYRDVLECVEELNRQPLFQNLWKKNKTNQKIITTEINGVPVKGKLDFYTEEQNIICDVKTTANIDTYRPELNLTQMAYYSLLVKNNGNLYPSSINPKVFLAVVDKQKENKRSKLFQAEIDDLRDNMRLITESLPIMYEQMQSGMFSPVREENIYYRRHVDRMACPNYKKCPFALQDKLVGVDGIEIE